MMKNHIFLGLIALSTLTAASSVFADDDASTIRVGMIGLDTSHVVAFTEILNRDGNSGPLANVRVVAAFPGGSPDIPESANRVEGFTATLQDRHGVEIVESIDALLPKVDAVFVMSVDGRPHLAQATPVILAGKPLFIDKPAAGSLTDVIAIFELAKEKNVPCFSSSSLRFTPSLQEVLSNNKIGNIVGCSVYSPSALQPTHPDLFWYGVHGVEMLYTIMGTGCETVVRTQTEGSELATGVWNDGRIGTFRGIRDGKKDYGGTVFGSKQIVTLGPYAGYQPLVVEICKFLRSGTPPVTAEETIEMFAFMEAADESKRQGGRPVEIKSVITKAREELAARK